MSSVDEVRRRIQQAFDRSGESDITLALEWGFERGDIWDFLHQKKASLKPEVLKRLSDHFDIPFEQLIITRQRKKRKAAQSEFSYFIVDSRIFPT